MNKQEFVDYIAKQHNCTKVQAEKTIDMFTSSVIDAMAEGKEISLIGFGSFYASKIEAREGRNPRNGESINIAAHCQPKFKVGSKLKSAVNKK
jgi:DNA-binding protein HU-beta